MNVVWRAVASIHSILSRTSLTSSCTCSRCSRRDPINDVSSTTNECLLFSCWLPGPSSWTLPFTTAGQSMSADDDALCQAACTHLLVTSCDVIIHTVLLAHAILSSNDYQSDKLHQNDIALKSNCVYARSQSVFNSQQNLSNKCGVKKVLQTICINRLQKCMQYYQL